MEKERSSEETLDDEVLVGLGLRGQHQDLRRFYWKEAEEDKVARSEQRERAVHLLVFHESSTKLPSELLRFFSFSLLFFLINDPRSREDAQT